MALEQHQMSSRPSGGRRRSVRRFTSALAFSVGVLYLVLLILVADVEADLAENTFGAYLFLSVPYLVGGVLLARLDNRPLYVLGALVQVGVVVLFLLFGVGVFEYEALGQLHMAVWAGVITGAEVVLLGSLSYLAATAANRPVAESPEPP